MKKILGIVVLGLLWCNTSFAESSLPLCYPDQGDDYKKWTNCEYGWQFGDGSHYDGGWKDGQPYGVGTLNLQDGSKYVGEFKDGQFHGTGTLNLKDGTVATGEFKNNLMHGKLTLRLPDHAKYVGEFKDGEAHGKGIYTSPDGSSVQRVYELGKLIEEKSKEQIAKEKEEKRIAAEYERLEVKHRKKCSEFDKETPEYKNCIYDTENKEIAKTEEEKRIAEEKKKAEEEENRIAKNLHYLNKLKKSAKGNTIFYSGKKTGTEPNSEERYTLPVVSEFTVTDEGELQGKYIYTYNYKNFEGAFYEIELDGVNLKAFFGERGGKDSYAIKTFGYRGWLKIIFDENFVSFNGQWGSIWKSQETGVITVDPKAGEWTGKIIEEEGISRVIKSEAALKATERKVIKDKEKRLCGGAAFLEYSHYDKYNVNMVVCTYSSGVEFRITTNQTCPRCRDY